MYPTLKERVSRELDYYFIYIGEKLEQELPNQLFFSVPEIAQIFGVSKKTVRRWIRSGKLEAAKIEGTWKVPKKELIEFVKNRSNWILF